MSQAGGVQLGQILRSHENLIHALGGETQRIKRVLYRLDAIERLREAGRQPTMPIEFRSQFGEDLILWEVLEGQLDGFFIECGAHDGRTLSVSYAFEAIGWKGLLVEALPDKAEKCRANRPNSRVVHAALSAPGAGSDIEFTRVDDQWNDGMLSYLGAATPEHANLVQRLGGREAKFRVPLATMDELLKDHTGRIDFMVLDVEGHELAVLQGFDRRKHRPRLMMIEDGTGGKDGVSEAMARAGYVRVGRHQINQIFIAEEEKALLAKAQPTTV